jgi:hypothetical protein
MSTVWLLTIDRSTLDHCTAGAETKFDYGKMAGVTARATIIPGLLFTLIGGLQGGPRGAWRLGLLGVGGGAALGATEQVLEQNGWD